MLSNNTKEYKQKGELDNEFSRITTFKDGLAGHEGSW